MERGLEGLRVVTFESRRSVETGALIRNHGGEAILAPSMREVPLAAQHEALRFGEALRAGECDVLILLTGVGTRLLVSAVSARSSQEEVVEALKRLSLVCRGPKPVAALKELGLSPTVTVPEPNTWRDLLAQLDRTLNVRDRRVAVQEYGERNEELLSGLRERGARVTPVPVYAWALPEDVGPLREAIERIAAGAVDVAIFTSGHQVESLFQVAGEMQRAPALGEAFRRRTVIASIGPITSEALRAHDVSPDLEPEHPKLGHLIAAAAERASGLLAAKRTGGAAPHIGGSPA